MRRVAGLLVTGVERDLEQPVVQWLRVARTLTRTSNFFLKPYYFAENKNVTYRFKMTALHLMGRVTRQADSPPQAIVC